MLAERLDASIQKIVPISGISIGDPDDRTTWRVRYSAEPTTEQRKAVAALLDGFDASPEADQQYVEARAAENAVDVLTGKTSDPVLTVVQKMLAALAERVGTLADAVNELRTAAGLPSVEKLDATKAIADVRSKLEAVKADVVTISVKE